jgi:hypothetical protein
MAITYLYWVGQVSTDVSHTAASGSLYNYLNASGVGVTTIPNSGAVRIVVDGSGAHGAIVNQPSTGTQYHGYWQFLNGAVNPGSATIQLAIFYGSGTQNGGDGSFDNYANWTTDGPPGGGQNGVLIDWAMANGDSIYTDGTFTSPPASPPALIGNDDTQMSTGADYLDYSGFSMLPGYLLNLLGANQWPHTDLPDGTSTFSVGALYGAAYSGTIRMAIGGPSSASFNGYNVSGGIVGGNCNFSGSQVSGTLTSTFAQWDAGSTYIGDPGGSDQTGNGTQQTGPVGANGVYYAQAIMYNDHWWVQTGPTNGVIALIPGPADVRAGVTTYWQNNPYGGFATLGTLAAWDGVFNGSVSNFWTGLD